MARDLSDARPVDQPNFIDGLFTTEFWTTVGGLLANLLVVLIAIGYVNREDADMLTSSIGSIVAAVQMLAVNGMLIWKYIASRTQIKQAITLERMRIEAGREDLKLRLLMQSDAPPGSKTLAMKMLGVEPVKEDSGTGCCQKS